MVESSPMLLYGAVSQIVPVGAAVAPQKRPEVRRTVVSTAKAGSAVASPRH